MSMGFSIQPDGNRRAELDASILFPQLTYQLSRELLFLLLLFSFLLLLAEAHKNQKSIKIHLITQRVLFAVCLSLRLRLRRPLWPLAYLP